MLQCCFESEKGTYQAVQSGLHHRQNQPDHLPADGEGNDNYYWENYSLTQPSLSKTKILRTNELFSEKQRKIYNYCFYQLKHFYNYDNKDIISCRNGGNNFNFLLNFYEGVNYINNYKYKISVDKYKNNLANLEREIYDLVKDNYISYTTHFVIFIL